MRLKRANRDLVELLRTTDTARLMVIKSLLDSEEIRYMVQGEESLRVFSVGISGGLFNPSAFCAILWVRREDLEDARLLLQEPVPEEQE